MQWSLVALGILILSIIGMIWIACVVIRLLIINLSYKKIDNQDRRMHEVK
ncbi:MAG: hypothetical protein JRF49_07980 [Deltaproteobacteria bacterium]|nr:hypothetical protein [Deltaproteobacteria bacterium]